MMTATQKVRISNKLQKLQELRGKIKWN